MIECLQAHAALDFRPHAVGPRLGAEHADAQAAIARLETLPLEFVGDREHVGRRHDDDVRLEVDDELYLPFGESAADRDHRGAEIFGAVVEAEPAREQAIAIGDVNLVGGAAAGGADRTRHDLRPGLDVAARVTDHGRFAGGAARCVHAHDVRHRHREHAERIILPQVVLAGEREFGEIGQVFQVTRLHACGVEFLPIVRNVFVGASQRCLQPLALQRLQRVAACGFDRFEFVAGAHLRPALGKEPGS